MKTSKTYKIRFSDFGKSYILSTIAKKYLAQNMNFAELWTKPRFFEEFKIS